MKSLVANEKNIDAAAEAIRKGKLVVMPTETVYGLAADATNAKAVAKIFSVKQRPAENPLIVHIAEIEQVDQIASAFPDSARVLAERFWPGPLTLVLPSAGMVAPAVTGGLRTVAVRMPSHPVALELIRRSGKPIAAPSANRFMKLSPTRPEHLDPELAKLVEIVLLAGPCEVGVESTVVDCTNDVPRILRPGGVSRGEIEAALGAPLGAVPSHPPRNSPGMYARHYAPKAVVRVVSVLTSDMAGLTFEEPASERQIRMPSDPGPYAAMLYDGLHRLDAMGVDAIHVQEPPESPEWEAVRDRLQKASSS